MRKMQSTTDFRFLLHAILLIAATLFCFPAWSQIVSNNEADSGSIDVPLGLLIETSSAETVRSVQLVLVPPGELFRIRLNEDRLKKVGCVFTTDDPTRIVDLINVLKNSDIKIINKMGHDWEDEPREGVFLTLDNDLKVKFLFGKKMRNQDSVKGAFFSGTAESKQLITGSNLLPERLFKWGATVGISRNESSQRQLVCEEFLKSPGAK
jgi:hypothetical protein